MRTIKLALCLSLIAADTLCRAQPTDVQLTLGSHGPHNSSGNIKSIACTTSEAILGTDEERGAFVMGVFPFDPLYPGYLIGTQNPGDCEASTLCEMWFASRTTGQVFRGEGFGTPFREIATLSGLGSETLLVLWESESHPSSKDSVVFKSDIQEVGIATANGVTAHFNETIMLFQTAAILIPSTVEIYAGTQLLSLQTDGVTFAGDGNGTLTNNNDGTVTVDFTFDQPPAENATVMMRYGAHFVAGAVIHVLSENLLTRSVQYPLDYTLEHDLELGDSVRIPDPVQSRLVVAGGSQLELSINPLNLGRIPVTVTLDAGILAGAVSTVNFTRSGEALFIGTTNGQVIRATGLKEVYDSTDLANVSYTVLYHDTNHAITGMALDPNDGNRLLVTMSEPSGGGKVILFEDALGQGTFEDVTGDLPDMVLYDGEIDMHNPGVAYVGTVMGIWGTADLGADPVTWEQIGPGELQQTPVREIRQQVLPPEKAVNSGAYYIATGGEGIWKSTVPVGIPEQINEASTSQMKLYPNPAAGSVTVSMPGKRAAPYDVRIYGLDGVLIREQRIPAGAQTFTLELERLASGVYHVVSSAGRERYSARLVVTAA